MIDFFASLTVALIVVMTVVIFLSNQRQAGIMKQMRLVLEDWYQAQMRDRRETYRKEIQMPDALQWIGSQVNLTVVEMGRKLENPQALEFLTTEGVRLIVSPLPKGKLRSAVRKIESKRGKVAKLVEPLLGSQPRRMQVVERSNQSVHEWFEVEIETAAQKLGVNWIGVKALYFYMIPIQTAGQRIPLVSFDLDDLKVWFKTLYSNAIDWFKRRLAKASG
jgi:hypothetical protein